MSSIRPIGLIFVFSLAFARPLFAAEPLIPNDPGFTQQWYLNKIHAPEAWAEGQTLRGSLGQGSPDVVVAIIDSGVDVNHPDLAENIWTNPREVPGNGIDDDGDGYIDDVHGWDFVSDTPDPRPKLENPQDLQTSPLAVHHGTILAGIIGAIGNNNQGIAGVNWHVSIMPIRAIHSDGTGDATTVAQAMEFAIRHHVNIINLSFVGDSNTPELQTAIEDAYRNDILVVAAAGNEIQENGVPVVQDLDHTLLYPVCNDSTSAVNKIIGVTATNQDDQKSSFASYGSRCIDVAAPGENILSTRSTDPQFGPVRAYGSVNGTSMSTAVVSGEAALLKALIPSATMRSIGQAIIDGADSIDAVNPQFQGRLGKGRINIVNSLHLLEVQQQRIAPSALPVTLVVVPPPTPVSTSIVAAWQLPKGTMVHVRSNGNDRELLLYSPWHTLPSIAMLSDGRVVLGAPVGAPAEARVYSSAGDLQTIIPAYSGYRGGVWVEAVSDSGADRIVTLPQTHASSQIRVFTPDGHVVRQFFVTDPKDRNNWLMGRVERSSTSDVIVGATLSSLKIVDVSSGTLTALPKIENITEPIASIALLTIGDQRLIAIGSARTSRVWVGLMGSPLSVWEAYPRAFALPVSVGWQEIDGNWNVVTVPGHGSVQLRIWSASGGLQDQSIFSAPNYRGGGAVQSVVLP